MTDRKDSSGTAGDSTDNDERLARTFAALDPGASTTARMEGRILEAFGREQLSLAAEWYELLRVETPLSASYALAAAAGLLVVTPIGLSLLLTSLASF